MLEFETFAYMDMQKSGSTFVRTFLQQNVSEKLLFSKKHRPVGSLYDPKKMYFITCRDPLSAYSSLYRYGREEKGLIFNELRAANLSHVYQDTPTNFGSFVQLLLDPGHAFITRQGYGGAPVNLIGPQTYRFLRLALRDTEELARCRTRSDIVNIYENSRIVSRVLRTESLNEDLKELVKTELMNKVHNAKSALEYLYRGHQINKSPSDHSLTKDLNPSIGTSIMEREWFFFDVLGYPRYR